MKVREIMTKKVISVVQDESVTQVARLLDKFKIHGVPVVDKSNKLVGIITESDFFLKSLPGLHLPSYLEFLKKAQFAKRLSKKQQAQTDQLLNATAGDIMTANCYSVGAEMEVKDLVQIFKTKHIYTIPVVNRSQIVVGIVTMADVIKLI